MNLIERRFDIVTGAVDINDLHSIKDFPVFMGCVDHSTEIDLVAEQTWSICRDSGLLQLKKIIPLDILYQSQHAGAVGEIWMEHHRQFSKFLLGYNPSSVFEIGGAHGILSKEYQQFGKAQWTILEPNPSPIDGCEAREIKFAIRDNQFEFTGQAYLLEWVLPNVFFHITTAYNLLRQNGVDIGKRDFLG